MPIITFAGGRLTGEQKAELVEQVTEAAHKVTDIHKDAFIVIIRDSAQESMGPLLTTQNSELKTA